MSNYSGIILDRDDDKGATLKARVPDVSDLPDVIKTASYQPYNQLPNENFALVMVDGSDIMRKYACQDAGNTAMSVIYFIEHGDKLPPMAQKTAADNLISACLDYDIIPPNMLMKMAGWKEQLTTFPTVKRIAKAVASGAKKVRGYPGKKLEDLGGRIGKGMSEATQRTLQDIPKNKKTMQAIGNISREAGKSGAKGVDEITQDPMRMVKLIGGATVIGGTGLAVGSRLGHKAMKSGKRVSDKTTEILGLKPEEEQKKESSVSNVVDITGMKPMTAVKTAAPLSNNDYMWVDKQTGERKFPIDSWDRVKQAENYMQQEGVRLRPDIRRACAVKLAAKAEVVGYPLDEKIKEAGATTFANPGHLQANLEIRKIAAGNDGFLDELFEKRASIGPEMYSECLRRYDIETGIDQWWGKDVPNPWESTFGMDKTAEVVWEDGVDRLTDAELMNLATNHLSGVQRIFTPCFANEFMKDPVGIFSSMPAPQKKVIARLAADMNAKGKSEGPIR